MLITRIPPSAAELVARALADTSFLTQIAAAQPRHVTAYAEIAASLAAEQWESAHHALIGETLPLDLIADVTTALVSHANELRGVRETELHGAGAKLERALTALATARSCINASLPLAAADALMGDIETHFDIVRIALTRALGVLTTAIDWVESGAPLASTGAM